MAEVWNNRAVEITCQGSIAGQQYINRFYVAQQGEFSPWDAPLIEEAVEKAEAFWELNLAPILSSVLTIREIRGRVMSPDLALQFIKPTLITGDISGEAMPNNIAACVSLSSGFAGRGGRGRMYIGGLPEDAVAGNELTPAFVTGLNTAVQSGLITRFSETGTQPMDVVIYSQFLNGQARDVALLTPVVTAGLRDVVVDSQRRRLPGRGR